MAHTSSYRIYDNEGRPHSLSFTRSLPSTRFVSPSGSAIGNRDTAAHLFLMCQTARATFPELRFLLSTLGSRSHLIPKFDTITSNPISSRRVRVTTPSTHTKGRTRHSDAPIHVYTKFPFISSQLHEARPVPHKQPRMTVRHSQVPPNVHWSLGSGIDTKYDEGCVMKLDDNTLKRMVYVRIRIDASLRTAPDDGWYRCSWRESQIWTDRCRHRRNKVLGVSR